MIYTHFGHDKFYDELFIEIKNNKYLNKPYGGLWASNELNFNKWKNFLKNAVGLNTSLYFKFKLKKDCKILKVEKKEDEKKLIYEYDSYFNAWKKIDFEKMKNKYDVLDIKVNTVGLLNLFAGWDFDTILVLNKNAIEFL